MILPYFVRFRDMLLRNLFVVRQPPDCQTLDLYAVVRLRANANVTDRMNERLTSEERKRETRQAYVLKDIRASAR